MWFEVRYGGILISSHKPTQTPVSAISLIEIHNLRGRVLKRKVGSKLDHAISSESAPPPFLRNEVIDSHSESLTKYNYLLCK